MFVIFDILDRTYHVGGGDWDIRVNRAFRYDTEAAARAGIEEVDCAEILRDRLKVRAVSA